MARGNLTVGAKRMATKIEAIRAKLGKIRKVESERDASV